MPTVRCASNLFGGSRGLSLTSDNIGWGRRKLRLGSYYEALYCYIAGEAPFSVSKRGKARCAWHCSYLRLQAPRFMVLLASRGRQRLAQLLSEHAAFTWWDSLSVRYQVRMRGQVRCLVTTLDSEHGDSPCPITSSEATFPRNYEV